jgi:hypothetical protein
MSPMKDLRLCTVANQVYFIDKQGQTLYEAIKVCPPKENLIMTMCPVCFAPVHRKQGHRRCNVCHTAMHIKCHKVLVEVEMWLPLYSTSPMRYLWWSVGPIPRGSVALELLLKCSLYTYIGRPACPPPTLCDIWYAWQYGTRYTVYVLVYDEPVRNRPGT